MHPRNISNNRFQPMFSNPIPSLQPSKFRLLRPLPSRFRTTTLCPNTNSTLANQKTPRPRESTTTRRPNLDIKRHTKRILYRNNYIHSILYHKYNSSLRPLNTKQRHIYSTHGPYKTTLLLFTKLYDRYVI